ncbi:MAG TPA: hypothetical protein VN213_03110, partial [Solirubrobacteraceae bacterium]|nr:hypothetical protein [Solirubrobacteraceae bacterium]
DGRRWRDVPAGDGVLDWPPLVAAARDAGAAWLVVEFGTPTADTIGDVGRAVDHLRRVLADAA